MHERENGMSAHVLSDEIVIVDDDQAISQLLSSLFRSEGYRVTYFNDGESFAAAKRAAVPACVLLDVHMPGRSGLEILRDINTAHYAAPIIVMSGSITISMAIEAIKGGAFDVVEIPFNPHTIVVRIRELIKDWNLLRKYDARLDVQPMEFPGVERLTSRERQVLAEITAAASNKEAGRRLGLSPRTVEGHRAHIMMKLGAKNTADLVRLVLKAALPNPRGHSTSNSESQQSLSAS